MFSGELAFMSLSKTSKDILPTPKMLPRPLIFNQPPPPPPPPPSLPKSRRGTYKHIIFIKRYVIPLRLHLTRTQI